ncbi:hypothetical protein ABK040_000449 [Willaertia magna]
MRLICGRCLEDDLETDAISYCSVCDVNLCDFHTNAHKTNKRTKDHANQVKTINSSITEIIKLPICNIHQYPMEAFCYDCEIVICTKCGFSNDHNGHKVVLIEDIKENERKEMKETVSLLQQDLYVKKEIQLTIQSIREILNKREVKLLKVTDDLIDKKILTLKSIMEAKTQIKNLIQNAEIDKFNGYELLNFKVNVLNNMLKTVSEFCNENICVDTLHDIEVQGLGKVKEIEEEIVNLGGVIDVGERFIVKFTSLGTTGRNPPTQLGTHYQGVKHLENNVELKNGIQYWTVPCNGRFKITAVGAGGGNNQYKLSAREGYGAKVSGYFKLTKGMILKILVGQKGETAVGGTSRGAAGGGGGTFVVLEEGNKPLIIGAGGNGQNWERWNTNGPDGRIPEKELKEINGASSERGGGGGGFQYNGLDGEYSTGGKSFINGGSAGHQLNNSYGGFGGFGGGGGSLHEGGGGGGYIGGKVVPQNNYNNSYPDYGAISFNDGENQENIGGFNRDNGYVEIVKE